MNDAVKGYLALASGLTEVTRQRAAAAAKALVAQGEVAASQVSAIADDILDQSKANREAVAALVRFEVDKALGRIGLASSEEVTELNAKIRALEAELRAAKGGSTTPAKTTPAKTTPARSTPAKKAAAKKAPAKTAPAKKAAAKKAPAKKAARG